jgi:hypothetical protein
MQLIMQDLPVKVWENLVDALIVDRRLESKRGR